MNHRELIAALTPLHGAGEARAIVRMVMEERFGLSQTDLLLGKDTTLSPHDSAELEKIAQRLLGGEPVQHVLGYADFCGHRFRVNPDVLIPRPETEELVQWAIDDFRRLTDECDAAASIKILDLCTGSGCIATSLALAFPDAYVLGVDISGPALDIARENAAALGATNVTFAQQDVLGNQHPTFCFQFSTIISNPPYVRVSEAAEMHPTVLNHEPAQALFVPDEDPLRFYRAIAQIGKEALSPEGSILVEINAALAEDTCALFADFGYTGITLRNDPFGRPRIVKAKLCTKMT